MSYYKMCFVYSVYIFAYIFWYETFKKKRKGLQFKKGKKLFNTKKKGEQKVISEFDLRSLNSFFFTTMKIIKKEETEKKTKI